MWASSNYLKEIAITFFCLVIVRQKKEYLRRKASKVGFADIKRNLFLHTSKNKVLVTHHMIAYPVFVSYNLEIFLWWERGNWHNFYNDSSWQVVPESIPLLISMDLRSGLLLLWVSVKFSINSCFTDADGRRPIFFINFPVPKKQIIIACLWIWRLNSVSSLWHTEQTDISYFSQG